MFTPLLTVLSVLLSCGGASEEITNSCSLPLTCIPLSNCDYLTAALKQYKNTLQFSAMTKFLKTQICGQFMTQPKVCCPDLLPDHKSTKKQLNESPCKPSFECVNLPDCTPLMYLFDLEKPVTSGIVKLIQSQQCGSGRTHPKVCCKLQSSSSDFSSSTIEKDVESVTMSLRKKGEVLNRFFLNELDDVMMFDFVLRRKKEKSVQ